jgi:hypothetical protein
VGTGQTKKATDLGAVQSGIFFAERLDDPNHIELPREISFCAHVNSRPDLAHQCGIAIKSIGDLPAVAILRHPERV